MECCGIYSSLCLATAATLLLSDKVKGHHANTLCVLARCETIGKKHWGVCGLDCTLILG